MSTKSQEETMQQTGWDRRDVLWGLSAVAGAGILGAGASPAAAQQVKYSSGTEPAKLKAPANACDCHHHIYGSQYKVDPRSTLRPGDATVDDYRALQKRIGTSRNVIVQPSTYGTENAPTLDALVAFGPSARAVVVVDTTVTDAELKRMHGLGARGIRFNLAQAGATTPEMIEPLSKRVNELGWHIQINASAAKIMEIMPILEKVPSPIVFDHLAHIPEPDGVNHPLFAQVRALIDKGKTWVKLSGAYADTKVGPPTYSDSSAIARAYVKAAPERLVWGSDWPHPGVRDPEPKPDDAILIDLMLDWAPDEAVRNRILVDNAAKLYDFSKS
ncbi:MAG: amidohydrolase family protein [Stellaceae bacterium]